MALVTPFDLGLRTRVVFGFGALARLGELAREYRFTRALVVADMGIVSMGLVDRAVALLAEAGIESDRFHDFAANPDTRMVEDGRVHAAATGIDSIVAIGGGSSLDCAKGINFVLTNGGTMRDYHGHGKAARPMLPMIGVPTTAGTGSEAQQYALISDAETHVKMACGDPKASFKVAILDPALTVSQPRALTATVGMDALSHAIEAFVTTERTTMSDLFAREAWRLLETNYERVLEAPDDIDARGAMLVGSHLAGIAIEQSMLGATHACANPLTARFGTPHGIAIGVMLPHVVRWNAAVVEDRYAELIRLSPRASGLSDDSAGARLAARIEQLRQAVGMPATLIELGATRQDISALAAMAATQWTGRFNPRAFDVHSAEELYQRAI
jgi:alcohol dehydrogenase